jgi:hypothetical protein
MLINGGLTIYEGTAKLKETTEFLNKHHDVTSSAKASALVVNAAPDFIMGFGMLCLGTHNLVEAGAAAAFDPTASTRALVGNTGIKSALIETGKNIAKKGGTIEHAIESVAGYVIKSEIGKKIGSTLIEMTLSMFGSMMLSEIFGALWENLLIGVDMALGAISSLLSIPKKINSAIGSFTKSANNTFTKILAKGLSAIVKPMTSAAEKVISKYIQPIVDSSRKSIKKTFKSYQASVKYLDKIKEEKAEVFATAKKAPNPKNIKLPPNRIAPKKKINPDNVTKKDLNVIRKVQKGQGQGANESYVYSAYKMSHIKPFNI